MKHAACWFLLGCLFACVARPASAEEAVDYLRDVKPILSARCFGCHGRLKQESGLRVDTAALLLEGGDGGPSVVPGNSEVSALILAIEGRGDGERMPAEGKPLTDEEIGTLRRWIDAGAVAPDEPTPLGPSEHWSFKPPVRPELPAVANPQWSANPIDAFIAARHEQQGLTPAPPVAKNLLLRRVYLDLIGLPPTPDELAAFEADASPHAYEKVVDRLLASPQYGERWARHWMDVWRYSDWDGWQQEVRESRPHLWRWRDWIIESLNADRGYDDMLRQMLAADELSPADPNELRATGFLARNWFKFNRNTWLDSAVEHTGKAFVGLTFNCARCHDHMYDPILQTDYYRLRAVFEAHEVRADRVPGQADTEQDGIARVYDAHADRPTHLFHRGNEAKPDTEHAHAPGLPALFNVDLTPEPVALPLAAYYPGSQSFIHDEALAAARLAEQDAQSKQQAAVAELEKARLASAAGLEPLERAVALAEQQAAAARAAVVAVEARIAADRATYADPAPADAAALRTKAVEAERQAALVQAEVTRVTVEHELAANADEAKRAELEKKVADAQTAAAAARERCSQLDENYTRFSEIYPATSTGRRTQLARWITSRDNPLTARVAVNHIWMRHFGSPLVSSVFDFGLNGQPPTHPELLDYLAVELMESGWQMKRLHRLMVTSQTYRQQSTSTGADPRNQELDPDNLALWRMNPRRLEAEAVRDAVLHVAGGLDATMYGPDLDPERGQDLPRRSLYFRTAKEKRVTFLAMFDSASVNECYRRNESVVPQQALAMANSVLTMTHARRLARQLVEASPTGLADDVFVDAAVRRILCRPPTESELRECTNFLTAQAARLASGSLTALEGTEPIAVPPADDPNLRAREDLVHVLLNHNDFVTVR